MIFVMEMIIMIKTEIKTYNMRNQSNPKNQTNHCSDD